LTVFHHTIRTLRRRALRGASFTLCALAASAACAAAGDAADDTLVVTGSREPLARHQLAADLVVIDAARIRASTADTLEDLLRLEAGVQLSRNGPPGQNAGVMIRGASSGQTLVLVDGVRVGSATLGAPEFDLLSLADIERIEVLRGPASSLYGADAIGGVVQIFTRRGKGAPRASLRLAAGEYGAAEGSASFDLKQGGFDLAVAANRERARGVSALRPNDQFGNYNPDRDGFARHGATLQAGWSPAAGTRLGLSVRDSRLNAQYDASEFLPPLYLQDASPDFRNRAHERAWALDGRAVLAPQWTVTARVARDEGERTSGAHRLDTFGTTRRQGSLQVSWQPRSDHQLTLALERLEEVARSSSYVGDAARDNDAAVLAYAGAAGPVQLQLEARHDRNSGYGNVDTGRAGLRWPLDAAWSLRALVGTSFRAPSFNDLVYPGYGVPSLAPERGRSAEVGIEWRRGASEATLGAYRQDLRDLIGYESDRSLCPPDPAYAFGCARNTARARLQGATLGAANTWGAWRLRGQFEWLDAKDRASGARLPRRAAQQQSLALGWRAGAFNAEAELLHLGARPDGGIVLGAETTLNLQAAWRFAPGWQAQVRVLNAGNADLQPARDYRDLGRQAWLVLRWEGGL